MNHSQSGVHIVVPKFVEPQEERSISDQPPPMNPLVNQMFGRARAVDASTRQKVEDQTVASRPSGIRRIPRMRPVLVGVAVVLFAAVFVVGTGESNNNSGAPLAVDVSTATERPVTAEVGYVVPEVEITENQSDGSYSVQLGDTVVVEIDSVIGSRYSGVEARARSIGLRLEAAVEAWMSGSAGQVLSTYRRDHHEVVFVRASGSLRIMDVLAEDARSDSPSDVAASVAAKVMAKLESTRRSKT